MPEKMTEDMRIEAEIKNFSYNELISYAVMQQDKMKEILTNKHATLEQMRMRIRLPRKKALFAAKKLFKDRPESYIAYMNKLNRMAPHFFTTEECKKYDIQLHPDYYPLYEEKPISKKVLRYAFLHRGHQKD